MNKDIPFGYKYDEKTKQLIVDEKETKVVKKVFRLNEYSFNSDEIAKLLNGISVYEIVSDKIFNIIVEAQKYNEAIGEEIVKEENLNVNLKDILRNRDNIDENIVKVLKKSKEKIEKIDSTMKEVLLDDIDKIINILNHLDEIINICKEKTEKTRKIR